VAASARKVSSSVRRESRVMRSGLGGEAE
jgi:hypothetical protein